MLDDDMFQIDADELAKTVDTLTASAAEELPQTASSVMRDLPRIDVFAEFRSPFDGAIYRCAYPWVIHGMDILDYYRTQDGWLHFLERDRGPFVVRLRHENFNREPSVTKNGVTQSWFSDAAGPTFRRVRDLIFDAIARGESPLHTLLLAGHLQEPFATTLQAPLPGVLAHQMTRVGDTMFPNSGGILDAMKVRRTIYGSRRHA